jgi:hypothetical protein
MKTQIIRVTPEQAKEWIENANFNNPRKVINWTNVIKFAEIMRSGKWTTTHQGIAFDRFGNLVDGQHRLLAIIKSGFAVYLMVTTGVSPDSVPDMDQGSKRNVATILDIDKRLAEIISFLTRIVITQRPGRYDLEVMRSLVLDDSKRLIEVCGSTRQKISTSPVKAAFVFFEQKYCKKDCFHQYRDYVLLDLRKLETVQCVTPSLRALHQRLTGQSNSKKDRAIYEITPDQVFAYTLYALKNPTKNLNSVNVESLLSECRDFYRGFISSQD